MYIFENVNVFDGENKALIPNTSVVVDDGKITSIITPEEGWTSPRFDN